MDISRLPFSFDLITGDRNILRGQLPVTTTDIYDGVSKALHPAGLFSTEIFGAIGSNGRLDTRSYIELKTGILNPTLFRNLKRVNQMYCGIMIGKVRATWNAKSKSFEKCKAPDGNTGYAFFMSHWKDIKWERNSSSRRDKRVDVLEKYRNAALMVFLPVIPAGMRDIEMDAEGNVTQDEINDLYRSVIGASGSLDLTEKNSVFNDGYRTSMQYAINTIYELIFGYLKGKKGVLQGKLSKRKTDYGTRSILAALDYSVADLGGANVIGTDNTVLGLYQGMKTYLPFVYFGFSHGLPRQIFSENNTASLIDKKTLNGVDVNVSNHTRATWLSSEGVNGLVNSFAKEAKRDQPVIVEGHYLALIYRDKRGIRILHDISHVGERDKANVTPITWGEMFYYICTSVHAVNGKPQLVTRYPINQEGSMPMTITYLRTTSVSSILGKYDDDWKLTPDVYPEFPNHKSTYLDVAPIHPTKYPAMDADNDGDMTNNVGIMSDDGIKEMSDLVNGIDYMFDDQRLRHNLNIQPLHLILNSITGLVRFDESGKKV